jgi:hypothetical protein
MKDEIAGTIYAKEYTDWHIKTGGFARDMTLRDHFAAESLRGFFTDEFTSPSYEQLAKACYELADQMLKERAK